MRQVTLSPFAIDRSPVTNEAFRSFVEATGHVTESERFGWSFVFGGLLPDDFPDTRGVAQAPWWRQVFGADWQHPAGPHDDIEARLDHPVVHVSWNDATAFAVGRASGCRRRRSGSTRHGAGSRGPSSPGGTTSNRAASTA